MSTATKDIKNIWDAAIMAVHPVTLMQQYVAIDNASLYIADASVSLNTIGHIYLVGVGKASAAMAVAVEKILGNQLTAGLVTVKHGHELAGKNIRQLPAAHPVPDESSVFAAEETIRFLENVQESDVVIFLLSGGASSLWCDIPKGLRMTDISRTYDILIKSGASIAEINTVRKHLSCIKGGQLPRYCRGRLFSLIISDVPGDDLSVIGSAPTFPDASTFADALAILEKQHALSAVPSSVVQYLTDGADGRIQENPKPGDPVFSRVINTIVGSNQLAQAAAAKVAAGMGYHVYLSDRLATGETTAEALRFVRQLVKKDLDRPCCFIQGGETVITVTGKGKGGRNQHFALVALRELGALKTQIKAAQVALLSCGTDGTDGPTDAAGALINLDMLNRVEQLNLVAGEYLANHDSYHFFAQAGGLIRSGPTQTNVMDLQMMIII